MKALQIALLVAAGAMAGAVVMKVWQRPQMAEAPPPVVGQIERPAPVAVELVESPAVASSQTGQPTGRWDRPPGLSGQAGRPVPHKRPVYTPARTYAVPPVETPERVATSRNEPAHPAAPAPTPESRSSGAGATPAHPRLASPLPETPQERPAPLPTPPARTEPEKVTPVPPSPPEPHRVTLNAGMLIPVRLVDGLSTERNKPGDRFTATLVKELVADDFVIAERGARVEGRVVASGPGKTNGVAGLTVELTRLDTSDGQSVGIRTESFERRAAPLAAGGKIGAGAAMSPAGRVLPGRDMPAALPSATRIPFRLGASVTLTERAQ